MSQSKLMIGVVGLAIFTLAPIQLSSSKIQDEYMETHMEIRTIEEREIENDTDLKQIKSRNIETPVTNQVEFVSLQQEEVAEVIEPVAEEPYYKEIQCELTYYTSLASCNGDSLGLTASGVELNNMTIAVPRKQDSTKPVFPFGTKIVIEGLGERIVQDTGNPKYLKIKSDGTYILDVYVPRNKGESDSAYRKRVLALGRVVTTAKVYLEKE